MRVPLSWLADYVTVTVPPVELAHRLTMAGLESTFVRGTGASWDHIVVGRVVEVNPHPNADRLRLVTADLATEALTVVCGAPNVAEGQRIAFARTGARLIDGHTGEPMTLTAATIRGVVSEGMVCSERELGMSDEHEGILVLPEDAPIGVPLAEYLSEDVLEIDVTANRGDCLAVLGVAREVAAVTGETVTEPPLGYPEGTAKIADVLQVEIVDPELCSRYMATVIRGVRVGPSPRWLQRRLTEAGQRPINNVVDVTNYVMLEYGQPLHAFDLRQVRQGRIIVRPARTNERFHTLDGVEHTLQPPMLLITDPDRAVGLAGVMGGANSEMTEATTDVLLESATFHPTNTRRTAAALKLRTEASLRFEKGLNPELANRAVRRATALILETAGGEAAQGIADAFPDPTEPQGIRFTRARLKQVLGADLPPERIEQVLSSLGFAVVREDAEVLTVTPPYWRSDVSIEDDLVEEVARIIGYDAVPAEPLDGRMPEHIPQPVRELREEAKDLLVEAGMQETISYTLVSRESLEQAGAVGDGQPEPLHLANPMSSEQEYLRTSLRPSLLRALAVGLRQSQGSVRLFEAGRIYLPRDGELPEERERIVGVMAGVRGNSLWSQGGEALDFFDAKGTMQSLMERLGIAAAFERGGDDLLHPGRSARVLAGGREVGVVGELHPRAVTAFDIPFARAALFELDLDSLLGEVPASRYQFRPFSRYPTADRDLALVVAEAVPAEQVQALLSNHPLVRRVVLFDLFTAQGLPPGKKSLAFHVQLQSDTGTLDTEQLNEAVTTLVARLERETGAVLRK